MGKILCPYVTMIFLSLWPDNLSIAKHIKDARQKRYIRKRPVKRRQLKQRDKGSYGDKLCVWQMLVKLTAVLSRSGSSYSRWCNNEAFFCGSTGLTSSLFSVSPALPGSTKLLQRDLLEVCVALVLSINLLLATRYEFWVCFLFFAPIPGSLPLHTYFEVWPRWHMLSFCTCLEKSLKQLVAVFSLEFCSLE